MLTRSQITTLLQIFCELQFYSQVIFQSKDVADNTFLRKSKCYVFKKGGLGVGGGGGGVDIMDILTYLIPIDNNQFGPDIV